jgi:hypothetical protein
MNNENQTYLEALADLSTNGKKPMWKKIGVAFPLKKRPGYSVRLDFIPAPTGKTYEFILVEPSTRSKEEEQK